MRFLNSPEVWSTLASTLRIGSNLILLPVILKTVPAEQLALWYIFVSLGAASVLIDFGLSQTVSRAVASFWAGARSLRGIGIETAEGTSGPNFNGIYELLNGLSKLYLYIAIGAAALMAVLGFWMVFTPQNASAITPTTEAAWWLFVAGSAYGTYARWKPIALASMDGIRENTQYTVYSTLAYLALALIALWLGGGILALAIGQVIQPLLNSILAAGAIGRRIDRSQLHGRGTLSAVRPMWATTWRTGVVMIGAYLINNVNLLLCSKYLGLEMTAAYGLSNQLIFVLSSIAGSLLSLRIPQIVSLRVQGQTALLNVLIGRQIVSVMGIYLAGAVVILFLGENILHVIGSKTPLLSFGALGFFLFYRMLELHHSNFGAIVMTENHVPFVIPALVSGIAILVVGSFTVQRFGIWGLLGTTAIVQACYNNWWPVWRALSGLNCGYFQLMRLGIKSLMKKGDLAVE